MVTMNLAKNQIILLVLLALVLLRPESSAKTVLVPSEQPTIQAGIDATVNGDIVLVADGTYTGTGNRAIRYNGKTITGKSQGGAENCIIDCQGAANAFEFRSGESASAILDGFTIKNANSNFGGAIQSNLGASPTIQNCIFRSNSGNLGGAFFADNGSSNKIINCQFYGNSANSGGAIHLQSVGSTFSLINCVFVDNSASRGGALYLNNGRCIITNCTF